MVKTNIVTNLLVAFKTNYIAKNKFAYCTYNKFLFEVLLLLYKDGLINGYNIDFNKNKIKIHLKYIKDKPIFQNINLISRPSLPIFVKAAGLTKYEHQYNYFIITTSTGVLSYTMLQNANFVSKEKIGGQLLFGLNLNVS